MDIIQIYTIVFFLGLFGYHVLLAIGFQRAMKKMNKEEAEKASKQLNRLINVFILNIFILLPIAGRVLEVW